LSPWRINRLVLQAFATNPPTSMREVANRYGELLVNAHKTWRELLKKAGEEKTPVPEALPDLDQEELRRVLYGVDSPVLVPNGAIVDLEWFFDEGGRVELAKLQAEIDRWIIKSASPPYAVILADCGGDGGPVVGREGAKIDDFYRVIAQPGKKNFTFPGSKMVEASLYAFEWYGRGQDHRWCALRRRSGGRGSVRWITLACRECEYQCQQEADAAKFFHVASHASKFNLRQARQRVRRRFLDGRKESSQTFLFVQPDP